MPDLLELMSMHGYQPRKCSTVHGGEYSSGCPVCGDGGKGAASDRFHIWPARPVDGLARVGRYWCRQCGISGDAISFLQTVDGMTFPAACSELGIVLPNKKTYQKPKRYQPAPERRDPKGDWKPTAYPLPCETWQLKAENLLADCQERLAGDKEAMEWLEARGINRPMAQLYGLGYNESSKGKDRYRPWHIWGLPVKQQNGKEKRLWLPRGWVIPCRNEDGLLTQLRIRRLAEDIARFGERIKYLPIDGSSPATLVLHPGAEVFVVVESGFDAILLAGVMCGKVGAVCTWNSSARPDARAHALLSSASCILGALDYDQGGDREQQWWAGRYKQYRRLPPLPGGAKDPGDAYQAGADLRKWIVAGMPAGLRLKLKLAGDVQPPKKVIVQEKVAPEEQAPKVVELELVDGKTIYVTNDPQAWQQLQDEGKVAFSENELERLKTATMGMDEEERLAAGMRAIEAKEVFGGYIRAGRVV